MWSALALVEKNRKDNKIMRDDEIAVVFCNQKVADKLIAETPDIKGTCVIWDGIKDNVAIIASRDEFVEWLEENGE